MTDKLRTLIDKHKTNFSVIMTFYVLLEDFKQYITKNKKYDGLLSRDVRTRYNIKAQEYRKKDFANSYIQRHTKTNDLFIENNSLYKIRPELLKGILEIEAVDILFKIKSNLESYINERMEVVESIEDVKKKQLPENELRSKLEYFMKKKGFNKGQLFEIISFAILHEYFKSFGFSLNRFSTTFSNDGGIDFIAQDCVYQVTYSPTTKKLESDLDKLPEIKRVMVLPTLSFRNQSLLSESDLVHGVITTNDLLDHFLPRLHKMNLSNQMFDTIIFELKREM